jgi:hypothetical protein
MAAGLGAAEEGTLDADVASVSAAKFMYACKNHPLDYAF